MGKYSGFQEVVKPIADEYGYEAQSRQCIEEMAELTQAINKFWRKCLKCGKVSPTDWRGGLETAQTDEYKAWENLIEEMADTEIMLGQMKYLLDCADWVNDEIAEKVKRQKERIEQSHKLNCDEAIKRLEGYRIAAEQGGARYDTELHEICIAALKEKREREGARE